MTVIAWDGKTIACDRRISSDQMCWIGTKLFKLNDGRAVAFYGDVSNFRPLVDWLNNHADPDKWPKTQKDERHASFVVVGDGQVISYENSPFPIPHESEYMAWGSGREIAMGALAMGSGAYRAIEIASMHSVHCGGGVDSHLIC